ncbi:MAG: hypothetical protein AAF170_08485 [Bacteroidota bacterium]
MLETPPQLLTSLIGRTVRIEWALGPDSSRCYEHVVRSIDVQARFIQLAAVDGSVVGKADWYHLDTIARISD